MISGQIESIAFGGDGILKDNGLVIFVPFTAPQDRVTVSITKSKKNCAFGVLHSLDAPGPDRVQPRCPYFGTCGGCQFQHLSYPAQLEIKRRFIEDALHRIAKLPFAVSSITPAPHHWHYRHHITLRLHAQGDGFQAGYTSCDHAQLLYITECPIFCEKEDPILIHVQELVEQLANEQIQEATLRLLKSQEKYILAFSFFPQLPKNISVCAEFLKKFPEIQCIFVKSPKEQREFGTAQCQTESLGIQAAFSPYGFVQNFPEQRDAIYRAILDNVPKKVSRVLDLYCGIGITSLLFSRLAEKVMGIEVNPASIAMAKRNAQSNQIDNVAFHQQKAEDNPLPLLRDFKPDHVLCNPPREGLEKSVVDSLIREAIPHVQYLSCMPSTLARDIKHFVEGGYVIESVQGFDMFPQTTHVETLVHLCYVKK